MHECYAIEMKPNMNNRNAQAEAQAKAKATTWILRTWKRQEVG